MKAHFERLAAYNRWANARLYEAAFALSDADYRRDVGALFKSMHGTLNHLLLTDRIWLKRLTGEGDHPNRLDAIIHESRRDLALARLDEDDRIMRYVDTSSMKPISTGCKVMLGLRVSPSKIDGETFSPTSSTTKHTIEGRRTQFCRSARAMNRLRSICWPWNGAFPRRIFGRCRRA